MKPCIHFISIDRYTYLGYIFTGKLCNRYALNCWNYTVSIEDKVQMKHSKFIFDFDIKNYKALKRKVKYRLKILFMSTTSTHLTYQYIQPKFEIHYGPSQLSTITLELCWIGSYVLNRILRSFWGRFSKFLPRKAPPPLRAEKWYFSGCSFSINLVGITDPLIGISFLEW